VFALRSDALNSIVDALLPQQLLDVYKIRGALANNLKKQEADLKSIANSGWNAELIPEQQILQSQYPEVLSGIQQDQARIQELDALFAAANQVSDDDDSDEHEHETDSEQSTALPKARVKELKDSKKDHNGQLRDLKKELRYLNKESSPEAIKRATAIEQGIKQHTHALDQIDQQLQNHTVLEQELKSLKAGLKDTEKRRDELVATARESIDAGEAKSLIEARFRQELHTELEAYLRAFTTDITKSVENLHNKYAVTVKQILSERDAQAELLDGFLAELGYDVQDAQVSRLQGCKGATE
jgi:type I restriction enzyme M protein